MEEYIEECLNSLTKQTYENIEIIVVDDGLTDNSLAICDKCAEKDSRNKVIFIKYHQQLNLYHQSYIAGCQQCYHLIYS